MSPNKRIKKEARLRLNERWPGALAVSAVLWMAFFFLALLNEFLMQVYFGFDAQRITEEMSTASLFHPLGLLQLCTDLLVIFPLLLPLRMGAAKYFYAQATDQPTSAAVVFDYFTDWNKYFSALTYNLRLALRLLQWALCSFAPGLICHLVVQFTCKADFLAYENALPGDPIPTGILLTACGNLLLLLGLFFFLPQAVRYFLADYLFLQEETLSHTECFARSVALLRPHRGKVISLGCSMLGWYLLCFLGFPLLYVFPLSQMSFAVSAKWLLRLNSPAPDADLPQT